MNKEYANNLKLHEIIMLGTNKISYAMLLTVILISVMIHTSVSAKDFNEKMGDLSVSTAENLIAIQKGVENTKLLSEKTKEGLAALRNNRKLINNISKKLGNKRYADKLNGAVRQLTKNITKMDGAFKKLGNSKFGKVSRQLTKGVGKTINVAESVTWTTGYIAKTRNLLKEENISYEDKVAILGMDGFVRIADTVIPLSGTLTKSINDNMKGIGREMDKIRNSLHGAYMREQDFFDKLVKKELFKNNIKNNFKAKINQASDIDDLQNIYSSVLIKEVELYENLVKRIESGIEWTQTLKSFPGKESHIKSLESFKQQVENRLERIKSGDNPEKQLSDIFYLTAASIIAEKADQQQQQTHDSINAQADQLAANKERILSIANQANKSSVAKQTNYNYNEYPASNLLSINETEPRLRQQNIKQAINEKYKQKIQAERAAKRRQEQQRIKQKIEKINRKTQAERATSSGAGRVLSAADSLRLGGNFAYGTVAYGKRFASALGPYRNQSAPLTKNGGNKSASLFFDALLEKTTSNSRRFSDRVKASSAGYGDYNHTAWGAWSAGPNTRLNFSSSSSSSRLRGNIQGGHWVYGQRLGVADIPKSGSARYVGQVMGGWYPDFRDANAIGEMNSITGNIKMAVNFRNGNNSMSGSLNLKRSGADWASARFNTLNARSAPNEEYRTSDHFSTLFSGGNLTGSFFGANAAEVGGTFSLAKGIGPDRGRATGIFRAKNMGNISDVDRLRSGNYAFGTILGGNFSRNSGSQSGFIGVDTPSVDGGTVDRYLFGYARNILPVIRNGNSISIGLSFDNLKESVPSNSSNNASLVSSNRIRARSGDYGDYSYIAWGSWAGGENTRYRNYDRIRGGHWIYGQRLGTVDIPKSGSARYIGQVRGDYVNRDRATVEMNSITGDINMNFTFRDSNFSLSGVMNLDRNGEDWATARFNRQNARSGNIFRTSLKVQGGGRGQLRGSFFGANAAEAGGSFAVNKDGIAVGVFRAKKQ